MMTQLDVSVETYKKTLRWLWRQKNDVILNFIILQNTIYFELKKEVGINYSTHELILLSNYQAAYQLYMQKNTPTLGVVKRIPTNTKQDWMLDHQAIIKELVKQHTSSREISMYILQHHRKSISHTMINNFINNKGYKNA